MEEKGTAAGGSKSSWSGRQAKGQPCPRAERDGARARTWKASERGLRCRGGGGLAGTRRPAARAVLRGQSCAAGQGEQEDAPPDLHERACDPRGGRGDERAVESARRQDAQVSPLVRERSSGYVPSDGSWGCTYNESISELEGGECGRRGSDHPPPLLDKGTTRRTWASARPVRPAGRPCATEQKRMARWNAKKGRKRGRGRGDARD